MMSNDYSLADISAATGGNRNNNDGIFGGNGAWFLIILFLFAFMGWGGGWGGRTGGNGTDAGAINNYVLTSDFSQLSRQLSDGFATQERKLDSITNGLCDGFYTTAQLVNGVQMQMANNTAALQQTANNGFSNVTMGIMQTGNTIQSQIAQCCCDNKSAIADLKYTIAQGDCATGQAITLAARDIIDNQNANYRSLHDEIVANRIEDKNAQINALQQQVFAQQLAASQAAQNNYLVDKLGTKCPIPAYLTCNPNAPLNYTVNTGCGCA